MNAETGTALRNSGFLVAQQVAQVISGLLFAVLVVRAMGPGIYGQYALMTSLSLWFVLGSALGLTQVVGRYVPQFTLVGDQAGLVRFFGGLLGVRLVSGGLAASLYLAFTMLWLRDLHWIALATMGGVVFIRSLAHLFYALFLGLNQAARWGMGQVLREWVGLAILLPGFYLAGLRGAGLALLLAELIVLAVALTWAGSYIRGLRLSLNLSPYVRFGLFFFASDMLWTAFQYSGELMVKALAADYAQVGYFGLAYNIYLTAVTAVAQITVSFVPPLTALVARGQPGALRRWAEHLLKWLAVGGVLAVFGALFLGEEAVSLVFGAAYRPMAINLIPLALALFTLAVSSVTQALAMVYERPETAFRASCVRLAVFWAAGIPLIAWRGSLGGCLAVLVASALHAAYFAWRMRGAVRYSLWPVARVISVGMLFAPLIWLRGAWWMNAALFGLATAGYGGLLLLLRIVTLGEADLLWQAIRSRGQALGQEI